jgi:hypothetical protein
VRQPLRHHAVVFPHHQYPRRGFGGWLGPVLPLTPTRRRGEASPHPR